MRKIYNLLVMLILSVIGFSASAATITINVDVDDPSAVKIVQSYWDNNAGTMVENIPTLKAGANVVNLVDAWDTGASSFDLQLIGNASFTQVTVNGVEENLQWVYNGALNLYVSSGANIVVRTTGGGGSGSGGGEGGGEVSQSSITIYIDNPNAVEVFDGDPTWDNSNKINLNVDSNTYSFDGESTTIKLRDATDAANELQSVMKNGSPIAWSSYWYTIPVVNGDVISITAGSSGSTTTYRTLTFASGTNLNAISSITTTGGTEITGWQSTGSVEIEDGLAIFLYFDTTAFEEISDFTINGVAQSAVYSPYYIEMTENKTISFSAKEAAAQVMATVNFRVDGWTGEGLEVHKGNATGASAWDTELTVGTTFSDQFALSDEITTQAYYINTTGDYKLTSVTVNGSSKQVIAETHCEIVVEDGASVVISMYKYVDPRTATLHVTADMKNFDGDIYISNGSNNIKSERVVSNNFFKFDPNSASDRTFTISSSQALWSVKKNNVTISGTTSFSLGSCADGDQIEIIAMDPDYVPPTNSIIIFDDQNDNAAISRVLLKNEDVADADWQTGSIPASQGDYFVVYFATGYEISEVVFDGTTYTFDPKKTTAQPLEKFTQLTDRSKYDAQQYYTFSAKVQTDYATFSFTSNKPTPQVIEKNVTFNVNIPAGVKITDITDAQNKVQIPATAAAFQHSFTEEYNYIDIEAAEGYNLVSVSVNPNNGNASFSPNVSDNKVGSQQVDNDYIITIVVEEAPAESEYGSFVLNLVGETANVNMMNASTNATVAMQEGANVIDLEAETTSYNIIPVNAGIEYVKVNDVEVTPTVIQNVFTYYSITVTDRDEVVIKTVGAVEPVLTVNIAGDINKISSLTTEANRTGFPLALGANTVPVAAQGKTQFMLSVDVPVYSVKLNGNALTAGYGGYAYMFEAGAGDVLDIETEFPQTDANISWSFNGCDASIITAININNEGWIYAEDEAFADYIGGFSIAMGANIQYKVDTTNFNVTAISHNGSSELTNEAHGFAANSDITISITATAKRVFTYTLKTNMPEALLVYQGQYGMGQPVEVSTETELEISEISGSLYITVGVDYGYLFDVPCTIDGATINAGSEGYMTIYPDENSEIVITLKEVERPYTATITIDDISNFDYVNLVSGRFGVSDLTTGNNTFSFNDDDMGLGFTLNVGSSTVTPVIKINGEEAAYNSDTHQVTGIMLSDKDVIEITSGAKLYGMVTFSGEDASKFTVSIDGEIITDGWLDVRVGTEIVISAAADANDPWVCIDEGNYVRVPAGGSYSFVTTGDHNIEFGEDYDAVTSGISGVTAIEGNADVYNMQGVCIKRAADRNDLKTLAPGFYIVGGKKMIIK